MSKNRDLPEGVAAMYIEKRRKMVCILVKADKGGGVPKFNMQIHPLAVGVAFVHPNDRATGVYDSCKGKMIARGRALKMYCEIQEKPTCDVYVYLSDLAE